MSKQTIKANRQKNISFCPDPASHFSVGCFEVELVVQMLNSSKIFTCNSSNEVLWLSLLNQIFSESFVSNGMKTKLSLRVFFKHLCLGFAIRVSTFKVRCLESKYQSFQVSPCSTRWERLWRTEASTLQAPIGTAGLAVPEHFKSVRPASYKGVAKCLIEEKLE